MYLTQSLHRLVRQDADRVFTEQAGRVLTYGGAIDHVARLAGGLRAHGISSGDRVAVLALNSDRYIHLLFAVPWADAVLVPINIRWSMKEIKYALADSEARVLFVDDAFAALVEPLKDELPQLSTVVHIGDGTPSEGTMALAQFTGEPVPDAHRRGDQLAGIFYTGGTTGAPKGVMLSHRNLTVAALGFNAVTEQSPSGVFLDAAPLFHLAALSACLGATQLGYTHVPLTIFHPPAVLETIQQYKVTDTVLVPTMMQMLVDHPEFDQFDLTSLRQLIYGASPIPEALITRLRQSLPRTRLIQGYGMTELGPITTVLQDADHDHPQRRRSAGQCVPHALIKIVDPEGNEVPSGAVGEIVVSGDHVMLGYWNKPEETAEAIRDGWMYTGDGGYLDADGYLYVVDRVKDMIISGGENVYSAEVENVISLHPAVAQCAVIGVPDSRWGERVHAVLRLVPDADLTLEELRAHCKEYIAGYKTPKSVEFVAELPLSAVGKILKTELRRRNQ
ncbi:long-chain-fatty-acid--CoA ligase [Streptomyces chartreusis]|uniref:long-chain-fatty-acid--CoA ligase n=1 Tax=Streptomyces chartreusis TaxID=1969 RepID=UPI0036B8F80E